MKISFACTLHVYTGFVNSLFKVNFNMNFSQATCRLIYKIRINCTLVYKRFDDKSHILTTSTVVGISLTDTVILNLDILPNVKYYFTATASTGTDIAVIEGTFTRQIGM